MFSSETLKEVPGIYGEFKVRAIDAYLPEFLVKTRVIGFPLRHWFFVLLVIPLAFGLAILITHLVTFLLKTSSLRIAKVQSDRLSMRLTGPVRILIFASALWFISFLSQSVLSSAFWTYVASTLTVIGATWLCVRVMDIVFKLKQRQFSATSSSKVSLLQIVEKLFKVLAVIAGALVILHIGGINIAAAITGLGIGGIAIAFAA